MGRAGADDGIDGVLAEVLFQEPDGGADPQEAGVGDEDIGPEPEGEAHQEGLVTDGIDGVDCRTACVSLGFPTFFLSCQDIEYGVWFEYGPLDDLRFRSDVPQQRFVRHARLRILRSVDDRLPSVLRQIFGHLQPPLHARAGCRRPVVGYDQYPFAHFIFSEKFKVFKSSDYILISPGAARYFHTFGANRSYYAAGNDPEYDL